MENLLVHVAIYIIEFSFGQLLFYEKKLQSQKIFYQNHWLYNNNA